MRSIIREFRCKDCSRRFKTHADLMPEQRICAPCRVIDYTPPPPPIRPVAKPSTAVLRRYKLTLAEYNAILTKQGEVCGICERVGWEYLIDHHHITGKVRGVLCHGCNTALGIFGDDPDVLRRAITYLETHGHYAGHSPRATLDPKATGGAA